MMQSSCVMFLSAGHGESNICYWKLFFTWSLEDTWNLLIMFIEYSQQ